jgi:glycosyltransferase involved in cell wall biosynthesis
VDDLATFYAGIHVFANPVREGRGMRTKVLEAAAYGRPVVSTDLGAEGLEDLDLPRFGSAEEFVGVCLGLAEGLRRADVAARNRAVVEQRYSTAAIGRVLLDALSGRG